MNAMKSLVCSVALLLAAAGAALADECCGNSECCARCGCNCCCQPVCRLVPATKKVPKIEYCCECEDFCVPGRSCHTVTYDECGCKQHCYTPTCGKVYTRTKLVKKETIEEKPGYKCVVEYVCDHCANGNCCPNGNGGPCTTDSAARTKAGDALQASFQDAAETSKPAATQSVAKSDAASPLRRMLQPIFGK
jgi:hypothetical protein